MNDTEFIDGLEKLVKSARTSEITLPKEKLIKAVYIARKADGQEIKLKNKDLVIDMARKGIKEFEAKVERHEKALKEIFKLLPIGLGLLHKLSEPIAKISLIINDALREALEDGE